MFFSPQPSHLFMFIVLLMGLLTIATDIWHKRIYNRHLLIGAGLGLLVACYTLFINPVIIVSHLINGGLAFLIGWLLYHFNVWRGGDAKLFTLYAFLMPTMEHETSPFSNTIRLFSCSFIIAMIIVMPVFIKDIISNYGSIATDILARRKAMFQGALTSTVYSWILFPVFYLTKTTNPMIALTISYLIFAWGYGNPGEKTEKQSLINFLKEKRIALCNSAIFGFVVRFWLDPDSLSWPLWIYSILRIAIFTTLSACIHAALNHLKGYRDRISFAPSLFMGCLLSYTPFLTWVKHLIPR